MGSGPAFSKLKKAIKNNSPEEIVNAMFRLKYRSGAKTHGENILKETHRALQSLKYLHEGQVPERVKIALKLAKELSGKLWDTEPGSVQTTNQVTPEVKSETLPA